MNLFYIFVSLVYSVPVTNYQSFPAGQIINNIVSHQEETALYPLRNLKIVTNANTIIPRHEVTFYAPEGLFLKKFAKKRVPNDPAPIITGIPKGREVKITVHKNPAHPDGMYDFISEPMDLKTYRINPETNEFEKEPYQTSRHSMKFTGYFKGNNVYLVEPSTYHMGELPQEVALFKTYKNPTLDLQIINRYPNAIKRMSFEEISLDTGYTRFFSVVSPGSMKLTLEGLTDVGMPFALGPTKEITVVKSLNHLPTGQLSLDAEMLLKDRGGAVRQVKVSFIVTRESDHIKVTGISNIIYPHAAAKRFDEDEATRGTAVLNDAVHYFNEQIFKHQQSVMGFPVVDAATGSAIGVPIGEGSAGAVGLPVAEVVSVVPSAPPADSLVQSVHGADAIDLLSAPLQAPVSNQDGNLIDLNFPPATASDDPFLQLSGNAGDGPSSTGDDPFLQHTGGKVNFESKHPPKELQRTISSLSLHKDDPSKLARSRSMTNLNPDPEKMTEEELLNLKKKFKIQAALDSLGDHIGQAPKAKIEENPTHPGTVDWWSQLLGGKGEVKSEGPGTSSIGQDNLRRAGLTQQLSDVNPFPPPMNPDYKPPIGLGRKKVSFNPLFDAVPDKAPAPQPVPRTETPIGLGIGLGKTHNGNHFGENNLKKAAVKPEVPSPDPFKDLNPLEKPHPK